MARLVKAGKYGQVELNQVAFRRDGRVEAQAALNTTDFATAKCENGMLLAVDKSKNNGWGEVCFATDSSLPIALVYSAEHMYDERHNGSLGDFYLGVDGGEFLPRLGYLSVGDIFTTDCVSSDATSADLGTLFGASSAGYIDAYDASIGGPKLSLVKKYTMPDGTFGAKFQVIA